ncbi:MULTISPECIES: WXG100 family type VII secretion target [Corynebacterium]|uniref:WXG100 family type VII secretion target n=1 Tax=Corynebacterium TaxID=1716 RepID=UPI00124E2318|nr:MULTISPECIES: WXG100 family type VII secretion target [Corynebacterium]
MDTIRYQFGAISQAAEDIRATSAKINGNLEDLKAQIAPMTAAWEGESSSAYQEAQRAWDAAALEINTILATISRTVAEGNERMSDVNRRAAASWS